MKYSRDFVDVNHADDLVIQVLCCSSWNLCSISVLINQEPQKQQQLRIFLSQFPVGNSSLVC